MSITVAVAMRVQIRNNEIQDGDLPTRYLWPKELPFEIVQVSSDTGGRRNCEMKLLCLYYI